ncbi:MAG TPA: SpoIIE family protein phosphatase, partial [Candidatus Ozemobacteraceae bacterium]
YRFDNIQVVASSGRTLRQARLVLADLRRTLSLPRLERVRRFEHYIERGLVPNPVEADAMCRGARALELPDAADTSFESTVNRVAVQAAKLTIDQYNIDHGLSGARQTSNADLVVEGAMEDDAKELMQGARTGVRKMISLSSGNSIGLMYLDVLAGPTGEAWYALFIMHNLLTLQMDFLATLFDNAGPGGYAPDPASPLRVRAVSTHHMGRNYPGETEHRTFAGLLGRIRRSPGAVSVTMEVGGEPHLVCARPATSLRHFVLIATVPLAALDRTFGEVRLRVWGCIAALALFGLAVLIALWYRVVSPIAAVSEGLRAMRAGVFDRPVPVTGEDELGRMCSAINLAMDRLREMELARTVQADLLPHERLDLGSFVLQGRNRMTKAVGGDYFDFIPLHRGLTAVILGDVSGHGVSAALVTAMAKAAFTILCPRFPDQPEEVLTRLNRLMLTLLNRAKMMSCFLGIIDTQTRRLMAANAGQSYPILLPATGAASFVPMPSQPLGTRAKAVFKRLDIDLREAGLLLYSDGMVEALNPERKMFGYEGLVEAATEIWRTIGRRAPAETDLLAPFFDRLQKHLESGSAGDDVTLVIIRPRD